RRTPMITELVLFALPEGMTREQVRFVLGSPLIADIFHADRWDYVYRFQPGHGEVQTRRLTVFFDNDKLVRVGGDVIAASETGADAPGAPATRVLEVPGAAQKD
ncbi:MAG: outer membrane protein assembly factor BamE, partial [Rhodocyclaceae bacterium]|nr:outer membrane protein assembly factor BamE [Rhodocyclaceae bacterium]